jgi:peptidoglycan/LPS O-acetylase OafA/YrhL
MARSEAAPSPALELDRPRLLDGIRGIGILWVVAAHISMAAIPIGEVFWTQAWVAMFFVLSGFLLYRPFVAARYGGRRHSVGTYAWRRALRLVPAAWVAIVGAGLLIEGVQTMEGDHLVAALTFTQIYDLDMERNGLGHLWSLDVEVALYAALGLWMLALARRPPAKDMLRQELVPIALVVALGIAWVATGESGDPERSTLNLIHPAAWMDLFAAGMALAVLSVHARLTGRPVLPLRVASRTPVLVWLGAALTLAALIPVCDAALLPYGQLQHQGAWVLKHVLDLLFGVLVLTACVVDRGRGGVVRAVVASGVAVWLGRVSFGIYLWHFPIVGMLGRAGWGEEPGMWALASVALAATLLLGELSYRLIERPAMRLGRRTRGPFDALAQLRIRAPSAGASPPGEGLRAR